MAEKIIGIRPEKDGQGGGKYVEWGIGDSVLDVSKGDRYSDADAEVNIVDRFSHLLQGVRRVIGDAFKMDHIDFPN